MEKQQVLFFRNLFLKGFAVGVVFVLLYVILTLAFWDTWVYLLGKMFRLGEEDMAEVVVEGLMHLRILVVFFTVIPAIALHWTLSRMK